MDKSLQDFMKRVHQEVPSFLKPCTVGVYARLENGDPANAGSGVLLSIADEHFLLTAAHIATASKKYNLCLASSSEKPIPLAPLIAVCSKAAPDDPFHMRDPVDVSAVKLSSEIVRDLLPKRQFINLRHLDPMDENKPGHGWYMVYGFPEADFQFDPAERSVVTSPLAYATGIYKRDRGEVPDFLPERDIHLDYFSAHTIDTEGQPAATPSPKGMSGCGMWRLFTHEVSPATWTPEDVRLVGIQHSRNRDVEVLKGTRIAHLLRLMGNAFPQLRGPIELHQGTSWA